MTPFSYAAAGTTLALLLLLVAEWRGSQLGKWLTKPLASAGFLAASLSGGWPPTPFGAAIVAALVLSYGGDVFLIPKSTRWFAAGLASFLLGHLAYGVAFLARGVSPLWTVAALPLVVAAAVLVHRWLRPHVPAKLKIPVLAYVAVISVMVILAVGTFGARTDRQGWLLLAGALSFWASDLAVARNRFVAPGLSNRLWGLPLYYGAQLLFAWTLFV
ncbi:MAG: lysoplasmalogenase [bacterium]